MNLHEYQGKELLSRYGVKIQRGIIAHNVEEAVDAYHKITAQSGSPIAVVKAQLHAGGRGKGGGVKVAKNIDDLKMYASNIIGMMLKTPQTPGGMTGPGKLVRQVLIAEDSYVPAYEQCKELYLSILTDRDRQCNVIIYSTEGGMDIETVAENTPHLVHKEYVDPALGLQAYECRKIGFNLGLSGEPMKNMTKFVTSAYKAFVDSDATMLEINPVLINGFGEIVAVDCKASMDDNALFRHKDIEAWHDANEEDPVELEAKEYGLSYVNLDGNVGCMVNGAGLAMATMANGVVVNSRMTSRLLMMVFRDHRMFNHNSKSGIAHSTVDLYLHPVKSSMKQVRGKRSQHVQALTPSHYQMQVDSGRRSLRQQLQTGNWLLQMLLMLFS